MTGEVREENKKKKEIVIDKDKLLIVGCVVLSLASAGIALYSTRKLGSIGHKLNLSIKDLKNLTHIDISNKLVDQYTEKAVSKAADKAAEKAVDQIREDFSVIMQDKVGNAIHDRYSDIKDDVAREVKRQISKISIASLKSQIVDDVKDELKDEVKDRIDDEIDDILSSYNDQLNSIGKIYSSIAESMTGKKD